VAWENFAFEPPQDGSAYIKIAFLPGTSIWGSLGKKATVHERGIYQVGISAPSGQGSAEAEGLADKVVAHFRRKALDGGEASGSLRTLLPTRTQALPEDGRVWLAVSIPYFVETFL
jgi:hypothetical protein